MKSWKNPFGENWHIASQFVNSLTLGLFICNELFSLGIPFWIRCLPVACMGVLWWVFLGIDLLGLFWRDCLQIGFMEGLMERLQKLKPAGKIFRLLGAGEQIEEGDEFCTDTWKQVPSSMVGELWYPHMCPTRRLLLRIRPRL